MNFNYKHIVWDWNGTLVDDAWLCIDIINGLLRKRRLPEINLNQYREVFDFPVIDFYTKIGFDFLKEDFHIPATEYIDEYNRRRFQCSLYDKAKETLDFFRQTGRSQSLLSASKLSSLEETIDNYSLRPFFIKISGLDDYYANGKIETGKDHLMQIGLEKEDILMIGDTVHDFQVADSLGIDCILIGSGHQKREKLEQCGAPVFATLSDFMDIILISVK